MVLIEQKYTLSPDNYTIDYTVHTVGLGNILDGKSKTLPLTWQNHLKKYEKGVQFEQNYSTVYYKESNEKTDYCSCVSDDTQELKDKKLDWIAHTNQFFKCLAYRKFRAICPRCDVHQDD